MKHVTMTIKERYCPIRINKILFAIIVHDIKRCFLINFRHKIILMSIYEQQRKWTDAK